MPDRNDSDPEKRPAPETRPSGEAERRPGLFTKPIPIKWIAAAILAYMIVHNLILYWHSR